MCERALAVLHTAFLTRMSSPVADGQMYLYDQIQNVRGRLWEVRKTCREEGVVAVEGLFMGCGVPLSLE